MKYVWEAYELTNWLISLIAIVGLYAFAFFIYAKIVKRTAGYIFISVSFVATILTFIFNALWGFIAVIGLTTVGITISLFANLGDLRSFLANPFKKSQVKSSKFEVEKIYNRETLYKTIETAVINLSKSRIGAIMTFEKNTSLAEIIKNGVAIKALLVLNYS